MFGGVTRLSQSFKAPPKDVCASPVARYAAGLHGFRTSWAKARERAGITGLTFHDLRGTPVVRLAIAGATVPQIAAITEHSLNDVEAILDAHYLGATFSSPRPRC